jgi:uncharacterized protein
MFIRFEWHEAKAKSNLKKHGITFEEAQSVFFDEYARIKPDPDHSILESRFIIQGYSSTNKLVVISFTERNETIRIINARKATKKERKHYEEFI